MKSWLVLLGLLVAVFAYTNTTNFYAQQLGEKPEEMIFQAYSGTPPQIQVFRK